MLHTVWIIIWVREVDFENTSLRRWITGTMMNDGKNTNFRSMTRAQVRILMPPLPYFFTSLLKGVQGFFFILKYEQKRSSFTFLCVYQTPITVEWAHFKDLSLSRRILKLTHPPNTKRVLTFGLLWADLNVVTFNFSRAGFRRLARKLKP